MDLLLWEKICFKSFHKDQTYKSIISIEAKNIGKIAENVILLAIFNISSILKVKN